jgi:hypothetical protein
MPKAPWLFPRDIGSRGSEERRKQFFNGRYSPLKNVPPFLRLEKTWLLCCFHNKMPIMVSCFIKTKVPHLS